VEDATENNMDEVDSGNEAAETFLRASLSKRAPLKPAFYTGSCAWCAKEGLEFPRRWCCALCRDEWETNGD